MSDAEPETRLRILEEARDIFLREGLSGLSMRKVAAGVGISATAIYRHFDSKEALLTETCVAGFRLFAQHLWRGLDGDDALDRLRRTGDGYATFALEQRAYYHVMFMTPREVLGFDDMPERNVERVSSTFQFLVDRVRECIDAGVFCATLDAIETAAHIWAHSHGLVSLHLCGHLRPDIPDDDAFLDFFRRTSDRLFAGLRT